MHWWILLPIAVLAAAAVTLGRLRRRPPPSPELPPLPPPTTAAPPLATARALLREGKTLEAERCVEDAVTWAAQRHGERSRPHAEALFDACAVLVDLGDFDRALERLRSAAQVEGDGFEVSKLRLNCLMNLGQLLTQTGRLAEAEEVLRDGLARRRALYSAEHPGYAYGAEALAESLLRAGQHPEALALAQDAVRIFEAQRHHDTPSALALLAFALQSESADGKARPLEGAAKLPDPQLAALSRHVLQRAPQHAPAVVFPLLEALRELLSSRPGLRREALDTGILLADLAQREGSFGRAVAAMERLVTLLDAPEDARERLGALESLALAYSQSGDPARALATYERAHRLSARDEVLSSRVRRNWGLYLAELNRPAEADPHLAASLDAARADGDAGVVGDRACAYGIFLQHQGQSDQAQRLLQEAVRLAPADSDTRLYAHAHLKALERGGACDCGAELPGAFRESVKALVSARLPPGLLADLEVELPRHERPQLHVKLAREPTVEERHLLDQVLRHAVLQLQRNLRTRSGSR